MVHFSRGKEILCNSKLCLPALISLYIFFHRSGIMSGGTLDLLKKAQRWDDKQLTKYKQDKDRITEELREAMKKSRKESELNTVEQQIQGLETRHKYAKGDREQTVSLSIFNNWLIVHV